MNQRLRNSLNLPKTLRMIPGMIKGRPTGRFIEEYPDFNSNKMEQRKFTSWLKIFARIKGWKFFRRERRTEDHLFSQVHPNSEGEGMII